MATGDKSNHHACLTSCPCRALGLRLSIWTAAQLNDISTVARLIAAGKDHAWKRDDYGYTPLHFAAQHNHISIVDLLLSHGVHPDAKQMRSTDKPCGATPLHRAAFRGAYGACVRLLTAGADVDAVDTSFGDCRTALHKAASEGHFNIVELLLYHRADPSIVDRDGYTYIDLIEATKKGNETRPEKMVRTESPGTSEISAILGTSTAISTNEESSDFVQKCHVGPNISICSQCGLQDIAFAVLSDGFSLLCQTCVKKKVRSF